MGPFEILAILFAIFSLSRVFLRYREDKVSLKEFLFWIIIWGLVILIAFDPTLTVWLSSLLGIGRPIDLAVYISVIVLFYLIFRVYVKLESIKADITTIVRSLSIDKPKKKSKK
ncbi:DUF2304 domain-containing protein [Nanoarchaeota archaeon]